MTVKKYWVFAGDNYYPSGGLEDFKLSFNSLEEAIDYLLGINYDWFQIVNVELECIVKQGTKEY